MSVVAESIFFRPFVALVVFFIVRVIAMGILRRMKPGRLKALLFREIGGARTRDGDRRP